jgi:hypothetical protein
MWVSVFLEGEKNVADCSKKKERKGKYVAEDLSKLNISSVHALELLAVCMHMQFKTALAFINQTVGCNLLLIMPTSSLIVY